uniref:Secreted peptide n=1 Tax=Vespula pensylvanica TaxID=30213 RepID=A0A834UFV1_VESPE|nr:hypothetical protein H0235_004067 [Vespula pensylvanica]
MHRLLCYLLPVLCSITAAIAATTAAAAAAATAAAATAIAIAAMHLRGPAGTLVMGLVPTTVGFTLAVLCLFRGSWLGHAFLLRERNCFS